tara:strand:+ start:3039 stop:3335 length:297 start_codon:yes stop_codon:yes gene_type:complete
MAYGLQVKNSSGTLIVDLSSRLPRLFQSGVTAAIPVSGSVTVSITGLDTGATWYLSHVPDSGTTYPSYSVVRSANQFVITNLSSSSITGGVYWWVFKS